MSLRRSFSKIIFDLTGKDKVEEYFDFIDYDPLNTTADITRVYVRIDGEASAFRLSDIIGTFVVGRRIEITCEPDQIGQRLALVLGKEYRYWSTRGRFDLARESIGLIASLQTIDSDIKTLDSDFKSITTEIRTFKFLSISVGTTPTPITSTSTLAVMLLIQNNSSVDVYLGDANSQPIRIPANGGLLSIVMPLGKQFDLSKLYLSASTSTNVVVMYS
jgi:hypothetical protein